MSYAKDIAEYLIENNFGVAGESIFFHKMDDRVRDCIAVRETGGFPDEITTNKDEAIQRPTFQIYGRGNKYKYEEIYEKMKSIRDFLDQSHEVTTETKRYISIMATTGILDLGENTSNCPELSINFETEVTENSTIFVIADSYVMQDSDIFKDYYIMGDSDTIAEGYVLLDNDILQDNYIMG